jgi:hypothetical protein
LNAQKPDSLIETIIIMKKQTLIQSIKKTAAAMAALALLAGVSAQAQTVIDPLNGTGGISYSTTLVLDNGHLGGQGVSFNQSGSGLTANYAGTGTSAEQALFLAPVSSFGSAFVVGDTLSVNVNMPATVTAAMDFGLAISSTATPPAANATGDNTGTWSSRSLFDWAEISLRPSQNAIRTGDAISGTFTSTAGVVGIGSGGSANISQLYIQWVSADVFNLGYVQNGTAVNDITVTFAAGSTIGTAIGFYGDLRATGTSLGTFSNLSITPAPEPSTLAMCGMGLAGLVVMIRRKK